MVIPKEFQKENKEKKRTHLMNSLLIFVRLEDIVITHYRYRPPV
jgi:hypothetical protein